LFFFVFSIKNTIIIEEIHLASHIWAELKHSVTKIFRRLRCTGQSQPWIIQIGITTQLKKEFVQAVSAERIASVIFII
jgi:S-adenosylmethionine/arginine decarboxylase-like enzyme